MTALQKIKDSVVSQQGRKDFQAGARMGFGDTDPLGGLIKCISIWAVGFSKAGIIF